MSSLQSLLLVLTVAASPDVTLLNFHSPYCGPCRSMEPVVERLERSGYAVRRIDVGRQPDLARRFGVRGVPCFVLMAGDRELDRVEGATSFGRLEAMFTRAAARPASQATRPAENSRGISATAPVRYRGQSPDRVAARPETAIGDRRSPATQRRGEADIEALARRALHATVRLRVEDADGQSWGTGTIVDTHGDEALVVTCGHIFRESQGKGKILVDLFAPGAGEPVPGELIAYDSEDRDIGLVAIRPNVPVKPVRVASPGHRSFRGDRVFSIGCNHGDAPTIRHSHVTAINKYLGPANVEVAGQPVDGRSGGGLFAADGSLIGVCNAADPQDDEGIYAALETIHWQLAKVGQERVFAGEPAQLADAPPLQGETPAGNLQIAGAGRQVPSGAEVLCIIRTKDRPQGKLIVVDDPQLIERVLEASRKKEQGAEESGPIIRAQSEDNHPAYQRR